VGYTAMFRSFKLLIINVAVSVAAGAACGFAIGVASAIFECCALNSGGPLRTVIREILHSAQTYGLGGFWRGAVAGAMDALQRSASGRPTQLTARARSWGFAAAGLFGCLILIGGWPDLDYEHKLAIMLFFVLSGAAFGLVTAIVARRWIDPMYRHQHVDTARLPSGEPADPDNPYRSTSC
jgi:hypothetical protein